jgi:hypothetical protein
MNRRICSFKHVVSWVFCTLVVGLSPSSWGQQALPPLIPVDVPNFTIPFELRESATSIREVELLVSTDRGRRWQSVARQPVESGKFAFHADSDGEHWFAFRTVRTAGNVAAFNGQPQLRISVNTGGPMVMLPLGSSESGALTPPKPERFRTGNEPKLPSQPMLPRNNEEEESSSERTNAEEPARILAPRLPGFESSELGKNREGNLIDDLLSGMSPFMDIQPVEIRRIAANNHEVPAPAVPRTPQLPSDSPAGSITGIALNPTETRPQIVVRWNPGQELWRDAQIDILRGTTKEGPWTPIAINLSNSGEYWWFLTPEDLRPFYVAVRVRSFRGGTQMNITQQVITVGPKLSQSPRP